MIVVDTHALLWLRTGDTHLGPTEAHHRFGQLLLRCCGNAGRANETDTAWPIIEADLTHIQQTPEFIVYGSTASRIDRSLTPMLYVNSAIKRRTPDATFDTNDIKYGSYLYTRYLPSSKVFQFDPPQL